MTDTMPTAPMPEQPAEPPVDQGPPADAVPQDMQTTANSDGSPIPQQSIAEANGEPSPVADTTAGTAPLQAPTADMQPDDEDAGGHDAVATVIINMAHDYMVPMSDQSKVEWVHHLAESKATPEEAKAAFQPFAEQIAMGLYPTFVPQIQAGIPVKLLLDPYVEVAKQMLGSEQQPDFTDPKWSAALDGGRDPKTGRPVPMSLSEWRQNIMSNPVFDWKHTKQGQETMANMAESLHQSFSNAQPQEQQP